MAEDNQAPRRPRYDFQCRKCGHVTRTKHAPGEISFCGECRIPNIVPHEPPAAPA